MRDPRAKKMRAMLKRPIPTPKLRKLYWEPKKKTDASVREGDCGCCLLPQDLVKLAVELAEAGEEGACLHFLCSLSLVTSFSLTNYYSCVACLHFPCSLFSLWTKKWKRSPQISFFFNDLTLFSLWTKNEICGLLFCFNIIKIRQIIPGRDHVKTTKNKKNFVKTNKKQEEFLFVSIWSKHVWIIPRRDHPLRPRLVQLTTTHVSESFQGETMFFWGKKNREPSTLNPKP